MGRTSSTRHATCPASPARSSSSTARTTSPTRWTAISKSYQLVTKVPVGPLRDRQDASRALRGGWEPKEIGLFVDSVLKEGTLPCPGWRCPKSSDGPISSAASRPARPASRRPGCTYTTDARSRGRSGTGPRSMPRLDDSRVSADAAGRPRPIVAFFTVEDEHGAVSSSPHVTVGK